jgi:aminopeptidase
MESTNLSPAARLARVFIDHSLKVKKGDKVVISTSDLLPLELIQETYAYAIQKGAIVYLDIMGVNLMLDRSSYGDFPRIFYENASDEQIATIPPIYNDIIEWGDKFVRLTTIDNPKHLINVDSKKIQMKQKAYNETFEKIINKGWVLTYFPTPGMAQAAGMSLRELEEFYYNSVLVDYEEMRKNLQALEKLIDEGKEVHIVGQKTDLRVGIEGRTGLSCFGEKNIPDGEVFTGPVEDKTNGTVYFEFPGLYSGKEIHGISLEFKDGKVVNYSSETNQDALEAILNTDEGAKTLGEFAIGANFNVKNYMFNTLFDEKIGGTIHMALGKAYEDEKGWGKNKSAIHWDIVKDMRLPGSKLFIDDKLVLEEGKFVF